MPVPPTSPSSNVEWKKWGDIDPLFGVATWEGRDKAGDTPWTDEEFYELGRSDWEDFLSLWQRYGIEADGACVEIGCGAGRLTGPMSTFFKATHGIDVAQGMLDYAKKNVTDPSVHFHLVDGIKIPLEDASLTGAFSTHVFQHFDSVHHATDYFREIARVLRPGGSLLVHLPIYQWPGTRVFNALYAMRCRFAGMRAWFRRRLTAIGIGKPGMRGTWYPMSYFYETLPALGFSDIEIAVIQVRSNQGIHRFVLARKSAPS